MLIGIFIRHYKVYKGANYIPFGLDNLEKRLLVAEKRRQQDLVVRISDIKKQLFPNQSLEERQRNFSEYYLEYGDEFIKALKDSLKPLDLEFTILEL